MKSSFLFDKVLLIWPSRHIDALTVLGCVE